MLKRDRPAVDRIGYSNVWEDGEFALSRMKKYYNKNPGRSSVKYVWHVFRLYQKQQDGKNLLIASSERDDKDVLRIKSIRDANKVIAHYREWQNGKLRNQATFPEREGPGDHRDRADTGTGTGPLQGQGNKQYNGYVS